MDKVKKVFIRSGVRFDYILADKDPTFFEEMCRYHVSGQLKVAPEHVAPNTLKYMGKPQRHVFDKFVAKYQAFNKREGLNQYMVPYFLSSHPGCTLSDAVQLAEYIRDLGYNPEQVQDFIPTPGSMATAMYYTGLDPRTMEKIYVPRSAQEKAWQRALLQYRDPKNYELVYEALVKAGREDLIGNGPKCLIKPRRGAIQTTEVKSKGTVKTSKTSGPSRQNVHKKMPKGQAVQHKTKVYSKSSRHR